MVVVRQAGVLLLAALISSRGLFAQDGAARDSLDQAPAVVTTTAADEVQVLLRPVEIRYMQQEDVLLPRAANIKGLYVNAWAFGSSKLWQLVRLADETEVNAFVIDVKDDTGCLLYPSSVPTAQQIGRASCRERVEISVVAVSLKKKNNIRGGETKSEEWTLLHHCLGHMSYKQINQLLDSNLIGLPVLKAKRKLLKGE